MSASSDGSGFHYRPEIGDKVIVNFVRKEEIEAYVVSASKEEMTEETKEEELEDPDHRYLSTIYDKKIEFTPQNIIISCDNGQGAIILNKDGTINITGQRNIYINAVDNINIRAEKSLTITASEKIDLMCNEGKVVFTEGNEILLEGTSVMINSKLGNGKFSGKTWLQYDLVGSSNEKVKELQQMLNKLGYKGENGKPLVVDGVFGGNTLYAVNMYKREKGLDNYGKYGGVVGDTTLSHMKTEINGNNEESGEGNRDNEILAPKNLLSRWNVCTTDELIKYVKEFKWKRKIKQLHVHHTWRPNHSSYNGSNGEQLQQNMYVYHTKSKNEGGRGWSDIGQHLTLLPDGRWIIGRDLNKTPASIKGWNTGSLAIEMVGNFDEGKDKFEGEQAKAMFKFTAFFVNYKNLKFNTDGTYENDDIRFHRDHPSVSKSCPGTSITRQWFMNELLKYK
jgi:peptidoglycan hydrolase-like protein with peptidoglycan-binding domain